MTSKLMDMVIGVAAAEWRKNEKDVLGDLLFGGNGGYEAIVQFVGTNGKPRYEGSRTHVTKHGALLEVLDNLIGVPDDKS